MGFGGFDETSVLIMPQILSTQNILGRCFFLVAHSHAQTDERQKKRTIPMAVGCVVSER
jgi:hypothetical protein